MIELKANKIEFSNFLCIYQIFKEILILVMRKFDRHKCIYVHISNFNSAICQAHSIQPSNVSPLNYQTAINFPFQCTINDASAVTICLYFPYSVLSRVHNIPFT